MTDLCMVHCSTNTNHSILPHTNFITQVKLTCGLHKMYWYCLHWALELWAYKCGLKPRKLSKQYKEPKICIHYCDYAAYCFKACVRWKKKLCQNSTDLHLILVFLYNLNIVHLCMITHTILSFIYQNGTPL